MNKYIKYLQQNIINLRDEEVMRYALEHCSRCCCVEVLEVVSMLIDQDVECDSGIVGGWLEHTVVLIL